MPLHAILARGINPQAKEAEEAKQKQVAQESIFLNVAKQWFASKQASVIAKHAEDIWRPPRGQPSGYVKSQPLFLISGGRNPSAQSYPRDSPHIKTYSKKY